MTITDTTRQKKIDESYDILESKLEFLGGTAIEDALQDDLSMTIFIFYIKYILKLIIYI